MMALVIGRRLYAPFVYIYVDVFVLCGCVVVVLFGEVSGPLGVVFLRNEFICVLAAVVIEGGFGGAL